MKKLLSLFLIIAMLSFSSTALATAGAADVSDLYNYWETNGYPDDVGGVYYDNATGDLVITLVGADEARRAEIVAMVEDNAGLSLGESQYAYNDLLAVHKEIEVEMPGSNNGIYSVGIGWWSIDGEVVGFGQSGKEFRVIVSVDESRLAEYQQTYEARYGDMVYVEASEAPVNEMLSSTSIREAAGASNNVWVLPGTVAAVILAGFSALLYQRRRSAAAMETVNGTTVTSIQRLSREEVVQAVKESAVPPSEAVHTKLMEQIDKTTKG